MYPFEEVLIVRRKVVEYLCEEQKRHGWKKKSEQNQRWSP